MSEITVYESRLRETVGEYLDLEVTDVSPDWAHCLPTRTKEQWCQDVSTITVEEAKKMFGRVGPPDRSAIGDLPRVPSDARPGVYHNTVYSKLDPAYWYYVGAAHGLGEGLRHRTKEHLSPFHRKTVLKRGNGSNYLYSIVEEKDKGREQDFHVLCLADWRSGEAADIMWLRETILFAEQIYTGWLRAFCEQAEKVFGHIAKKSHWGYSPARGACYTPPIKQGITKADPSKVMPTTLEESREKKAARKANAVKSETAEERKARLDRQNAYNREVTLPVKKMRAEGKPEAEVQAFMKERRERLKATAPPPKSNGKGKRYQFDTATERTAEDRVEDHKRGRKTQNFKPTGALGESSGRSLQPVKRRKISEGVVETPQPDEPEDPQQGA